MSATVTAIYRFPVKGLGGQELPSVALAAGELIPLDRAYAIENGSGRFDPAAPRHFPKVNFLMLMRNARLAALEIEFDAHDRTLTLLRDGRKVARGTLETRLGRRLIEQFITGYMPGDLHGTPRIVHAPGHTFQDVARKCLHIVSLSSVRDFARALGRDVDPLRFRANIYIDGISPWTEFEWVNEQIHVGAARLNVFARTDRCEAANVAPATGERDMAVPAALTRLYGHADFGIYATVTSGGTVQTGDAVHQ